MQRHNHSSSVILPAAVLAAFAFAVVFALLLSIQIVWFISAKLWRFVAPQQTSSPVYPEHAIAAVFEQEQIEDFWSEEQPEEIQPQTIESEKAVVATSPAPDAIAVEVHKDVVELNDSQSNDETLVAPIGKDEALRVLTGINRKGWKAMLEAIAENQQQIPRNFRQMTKNNSRADALLQLNVSLQVAHRAREIALQRQKAS
jgi:Na+-transporting methylmalonyl-CoA/oxaloacetate decarboxylase gamma subunit